MPADRKLVRDLFCAAAELPTVERAAYLTGQSLDADVRAAVERLLAAHDQAGEILSQPLSGVPTAPYVPIAERVGTRIGPYLLMEQIGEGGFGLVFVAEQQEPVRRTVALKIIKPGMDSAQVFARFGRERQALALMDHPHIAKVLDAGATERGQPYFVMELVRGIPITEYCDKQLLTPRERLELFVTVCQAIQHAHQKGIIHRDIKPSNVLVTSHDGKPLAKVIDFGVAKPIHQQLSTIYTQFAQVIGTPLYMSPEQVERSGLDIDTRSDIYSLGVLLYELLTGTTPLEKKRFAQAAFEEIRRLIREEEPPKPSARLSSSDALPSIAAQRHTEPAKLSKLIRGDLDWITMKALEKDRTRRYETANGLARDVQRYLSDEAVEARPPSAAYRLRKLAKKHRTALSTAAALALLLVAGITVSAWQAVRATRAETAAQAERREAEAARVEAQAKEAEANAVVRFFEEKVFAAGRPKGEAGGLGHDVALRDAIRASLPALGTSLTAQPLVEARLRYTLGLTFWFLGDHTDSADQLEQSRAILTRYRGPEDLDTLRSMNSLANTYASLNRRAEALQLREETLAIRKRVLPPDHPETLRSMNNLALSYRVLKRYGEAVKLAEETLAAMKRVLPPDDPDLPRAMMSLAHSYADLGRHAEAVKLVEETLAVRKRVLPPDHPDTLLSMDNLAIGYATLNRPAEALKLREETLAARRRVLPPDHPATLESVFHLANSYVDMNRHAEALTLIDEFIAKANRPGIDPPLISFAMALRARCYQKLGDVAGCRSSAEMLEKLKRTDATSLYNAACVRAITASSQAQAKAPDAARLALEEADRAMALLTKAVAAGWKGAAEIRKDTDLDFLRDREDFRKLLAELDKKPQSK